MVPLISDYMDKVWTEEYNGEKTFAGVLMEYAADVASVGRRWSAISTLGTYARDYELFLLPQLDAKPLKDYEYDDFEQILDGVRIEKNKIGQKYDDRSVAHFRGLIRRVLQVAEAKGICSNVIWGSNLMIDEEESENEGDQCAAEYVRLRKSLTVDEEISISERILKDHEQSGQDFGLALMFTLGLRNAEACAANLGDVHSFLCDEKRRYLMVYKSTEIGTNEERLGGKTGNVGRVIPIASEMDKLLEKRRLFLLEKVLDGSLTMPYSADSESFEPAAEAYVDDLPIACRGTEYNVRCSAKDLTLAGKQLMRDVKVDQLQLALIDRFIREPGRTEEGIKEKDPTAYLLRRNLGTHLYLLGLDAAEIQYIMGHEIEDDNEERSDYRNEEKLYPIALKMGKRPIVNVIDEDAYEDVDKDFYDVKNSERTNVCVRIPQKCSRVKVVVKQREPGCETVIRLDSKGLELRGIKEQYDNTDAYDRNVNVINIYQKRYRDRMKRRK